MNVVGRINGGFLLVEMQSVELKDLLIAARTLKDALAGVEVLLEPQAMTPSSPFCAPPDELQSMAGEPTQPPSNRGGGDSLCIKCGKPFLRKRKDQTCCSKACRRKNVSRSAAKKSTGKKGFDKICVICSKKFRAGSPIAKCCSPACVKEKARRYSQNRISTPAAADPDVSTPPPPSKEPIPRPMATFKDDRLAAIKAADRRLRDSGIVSPLSAN